MISNGPFGKKGIEKYFPQIKKIILGSNFNVCESNSLNDELIMLIKTQGLKLSRMKPEKNTYKMDECPIEI